jgi:hypothetical protein
LLAACGGGQPAGPADHGLHAKLEAGDEQFREAVRQFTASTHSLLAAWGSMRLDGGPTTMHFATVEPSDPMQPGAYVLGTLDGKLWLVRYYHDGRTAPFEAHDLAVGHTQPDFHFYSGVGIHHGQGHHHGGETVTFGLANGTPVIFDREYIDDSSATPAQTPERAEFAINGACKTTCPPVAGFAFTEAKLTVSGPVTTGEALTNAWRDPASNPAP